MENPKKTPETTNEKEQVNPFSLKVQEYFERIESGQQTIEDILEGVREDGAIFNALKEEAYRLVPYNCRDNTNNPFDFPILEDFLAQQTLSTSEEENTKNARIRKAILYFSELDWNKKEQKMLTQTEEETKIQELKKQIGIETSTVEPVEKVQESGFELEEKVSFEKSIQLPERYREHEQEPIGDLNGSYESFVAHLTNRSLATFENGEMSWTGQDKKVVFVGDILGDRTPDGLRVYSDLLKLKKLAEQSGGDVVWLSGNHENMFNAVLGGFSTEFGTPVEKDMKDRLTQYSGNLELAEFLPQQIQDSIISEVANKKDTILKELENVIQVKERTLRHMKTNNFSPKEISTRENLLADLNTNKNLIENIDSVPISIRQILLMSEHMPSSIQNLIGASILENRSSIKENIRTTQPEIIESLKNQQLIQMYDDTLYVHTNLTKEMVGIIEKNISEGQSISDAIAKINTFYQNCLEAYLDDNQESLSSSQVTNFNILRDTFISTSSKSRINFSEDPNLTAEQKTGLETKLKSFGVNLVIHGHSDEDGIARGSSELPILSIDRSAYKSDNPKTFSPISGGSISKTGQVSYF